MKHLSDIRKELPLNCLYNKVRVGCGGTTLALTNNKPYVIAVPYVSLIDSKVAQHKNILGVKAGVTEDTIRAYVLKCRDYKVAPKIMVTYDSLPKVTKAINPENWYILIDEYHILFQQYSFRNEAIRSVLDCYNKYKAFTFMTATPIGNREQYTLKELEEVPYIEEQWQDDNEIEVKVEAIQCTSVMAKTIDIVKKHLSGDIEGNAYFFCNSVKFINDIYEKVDELVNKNTRVIYSKNNTAEYNFNRGSVNEAPKKINFLTSTVFEGCDIYDENGVTYIISDSMKQHTLLDISSSVQQIIGRIRDSKYKGKVVHIYSKDRYANVSVEAFTLKQEEYKDRCIALANEINEMLKEESVKAIKTFDDAIVPYLLIRDGKAVYDDNLRKLDNYQYAIRTQYTCIASIEAAYVNSGAADVHTERWIKNLKDMGIFNTSSVSFKDAVKEVRDAEPAFRSYVIRKYKAKYPLLEEAINKLGFEKISSLDYVQKDIKEAIINEDNKAPLALKVVQMLNFKNGQWISRKDLKDKLNQVYQTLGIKQKAKATDIIKYYSVREAEQYKVKGYAIFFPLIKENK